MRDPLSHRSAASPDGLALIEDATGEEWTYGDLDAAVEATVESLAGHGVGAGDHLGLLTETRIEAVLLVHAAMRLGAVLVPLNVRLTASELESQRAATDLDALVCETDTETDARECAGDVPVLSVDEPDHDDVASLGARAESVDPVEFDPDDVRVMLFTSGTTGSPKAVRLTGTNLLASAVASAFRLGVLPGDRWLLCLSIYHMGGLAPVLRSTLYGTTLVLQEGFDAADASKALLDHDVSGISLVPTMLRRMLDRPAGFRTLRFVLLGGAPAPAELIERCEREGVPVHPTYGMTETASQIATARPDEAFAHRGTVGRPLMGTTVTVLGDDGEPLPAGEPGELVVAGPTVTPGYYGNDEATAGAFCERGLRTGDVGYRDEGGRLWVLNRREDRIVTGGENVHPGEVADALREHPAILDVAVVGIDDPEWGERVAAAVVAEPGATVTAHDVEAFCEGRLAGYKRPRTVAFVDSLPRTASGTVEREAVRRLLAEAREEESGDGVGSVDTHGTNGRTDADGGSEESDADGATGDDRE